MSGAAQARCAEPAYQFPIREATQIIENNWLLTDAELRLALIVLQANGHGPSQPCPEKEWVRKTHLSPRARLYAIRGLRNRKYTIQDKEFSLLHVEGEGDNARMGFDIRVWQESVRQTPPDFKPRTAGRTESKTPEPKLHAECRERGCQMLKLAAIGPCNSDVTAESYKMTFVDAAGLKQAVTQPVAQRDQANLQPATAKKPAVAEVIPHVAAGENRAKAGKEPGETKATEVSQGEAERVWAKTLSTLRSIFPLVQMLFVLRLLGACRKVDPRPITDEELAEAVAFAWTRKQRTQYDEGLFLHTVPAALRVIRHAAASRPPPRHANCAKCGDIGVVKVEEIRFGTPDEDSDIRGRLCDCAEGERQRKIWSSKECGDV